METIAHIIRENGGMETLERLGSIRVNNGQLPPLIIEHCPGPAEFDTISVAQHDERNGETLHSPEIIFEVAGDHWKPICFRDDLAGEKNFVYALHVQSNFVVINTELMRQLSTLALNWDLELKAQRYIEADAETRYHTLFKAV